MASQNPMNLGRKKLYFKQYKFGFPGVFAIPNVTYMGDNKNPWKIPTDDYIDSHEIVRSDIGNPIVILGETYSGKTCFIDSVRRSVEKNRSITVSSKYWVQKVELGRLAESWRVNNKRPNTFMEMCADYLKMDDAEIEEVFQPVTISGEPIKRFVLQGDLFLDGFDDMPPAERDHFLKLVPEMMTQKREDSPIRIWITCRNYCKSSLIAVTGNIHTFEIQPLPHSAILEFLIGYWKLILHAEINEAENHMDIHAKLKLVAKHFIHQISKEIEDPDETVKIICNPLFLTVAAHEVVPVVNFYLNPNKDPCKIVPTVNITQILEAIILSMVEGYCMKLWDGFQQDVLHKEFKNVLRIHSEFAIRTYPDYWCYSGSFFLKQWHIPTTALLQMGFLTERDGIITFHSRVLGDAILALFYSFPDSLKINQDLSEHFFGRYVLHDDKAKLIRKLLDSSLSDISEANHGIIKWNFVGKYLEHKYKLGRDKASEWRKYSNMGNTWHYLIIEGFHKIALSILSSIAGSYELKSFLSIKVSFERPGPNIKSIPNDERQQIVSSLSLLALFGYGYELKEMMKILITAFGIDEIKKEFLEQDTWTPLHYAAKHVNYWFICYALELQLIPPDVPVYNSDGQLPIHCLLSNSTSTGWDWKLKVKEGGGKKHKSDQVPSGSTQSMLSPRGLQTVVSELRVNCLKMFIKVLGTKIYAPDINGRTPLHLAAEHNIPSVIKCLVEECRVKPKLCLDNHGRSPLHYAAENGHRDVYIYLSHRGCSKNLRDCNGDSPANLLKKSNTTKLEHSAPPERLLREVKDHLNRCLQATTNVETELDLTMPFPDGS